MHDAPPASPVPIEGRAALIASLRAVDRLIARALAAAPAIYGWESGRVQFRGLFIGEDDVARLLSREPGAPAFGAQETGRARESGVPAPEEPGTPPFERGDTPASHVADILASHMSVSDVEDSAALPLDVAGADILDAIADTSFRPLVALAERYGLTPFEQAVVVVALAPEVDLRYERLYAFLQDDVTKRRPSVDLMLNLLSTTAGDKLANRAYFAVDAPLVREQIVHLDADSGAARAPLLARTVALDEQIVRRLLDEPGLDSRLAACATRSAPTPLRRRFQADDPQGYRVDPAMHERETPLESLSLPDGHAAALARLVAASRRSGQPLRLLFHGEPMPLKRRTAEAVASEAGVDLLAVDLARVPGAPAGFGAVVGREWEDMLRVICREAQRTGALVFLDADALAATEPDDRLRRTAFAAAARAILDAIVHHDVSAIIATTSASGWTSSGWAGASSTPTLRAPSSPASAFGAAGTATGSSGRAGAGLGSTPHAAASAGAAPAGFIEVAFGPSSFDARRTYWRAQANATGIAIGDTDLATLAGRFRLHPDQIDAAAGAARAQAQWQGETPSARHLFAAARAHSGQALASLARRIEPVFAWDDLILPASVAGHLRALCSRVVQRHRVLEEWGFERTLPLGKGVTALFAGSSGVGKTMAAEVIARELQLDLYKIDLSGIVSKYIGETEKNLERVFLAAERASAILFFDEADALFGKRSEVRDSHDRYANLEISYLLQKMEAYDGVAILASNLRQSLDDAFVRRLAFTIHFPFPDQVHRERIWTAVWPAEAPRTDDIDHVWLATHFKLSGGHIKNVALAAAFLAAEAGTSIAMRHVRIALEREYQKMGKPLDLAGVPAPALPESSGAPLSLEVAS